MKNIFESTRTIRRFDVSRPVDIDTLYEIMAPLTRIASAGNLQRIRYRAITGAPAEQLFGAVALGGSLPKEEKPTADVAPTAYVVMLTEGDGVDTNLAIDIGIAAQTLMLCASARGVGACIIRNFRPEAFASRSNTAHTPRLVVALGYPAERAEAFTVQKDESLRYYKDGDGVNRVPKLPLPLLLID